MSRAEILYLFPYVASFAISSGVLYYTWKRRRAPGAKIFVWLVAGRTLAIFGFILELLSPEIAGKIFWDSFQWLAGTIELVAFPVFAVQYTESKVKYPRRSFALSMVVPGLLTLALMTDSLHHLIYPNPHLVSGSPFPELLYDFTWLVVAYALYGYAVIIWSVGFLARRLVQPHNLYRVQTAIVIFGFLFPIIGTVFALFGIQIAPQRDSTPFTGALGSLVIAWGLFRYQLFEIVPIAREKVVENMADPVMVLDAQNRVVDINQTALQAIGKKSSEVIGLPAEIVLSEWMELVVRFRNVSQERLEITARVQGEARSYDLSIAPIYDDRDRLVGRIFIAHDITRRKNLEDGYRSLSEELEQRVRERTEELRESAERYRAVVENQTEFIVRWKPDGTRTFVNEAYCRYWDISYEQALALNFRLHIAEEDRPAVEQKIARLHSGEIDSETEIHRVIKPDGSIAWQEWTDHAIRDKTRQIVEFQSVGRDITERMQAEEALRESEQRFAALSTATFEAIGFSEQGKIIDVNEQMLTMFGYSRDEMMGMNVEQFVAPESLELVKYHRSLNLEDPYEHIAVKKDGTKFPVEVRPNMIPYGGRLLRVTAIRDMTERKRAEEALRKSEERFSKAFQASPVIIAIFQIKSGKLLEVNEAFERISGFSREEAVGKTAGELGLWANLTARDQMVSVLLKDGRIRSAELQFVTKNGRLLTCLFSAELIDLGGERCALAVIEDITKRKRAEQELAQAYDTTLEGWAKALELRDKETEGHSRRVTETTLIVARAMGFTEEELLHIRRGSILHDIGKMGIPDEILRKKGPLTKEERMTVEKHPNTALDLLKGISFLEKALEIPSCHHEKWDGSGYPCGLKGNEIPLTARIFAVVDVWDALSTDRPYREAWSRKRVVQYLIKESGKHFDPKVVEIFLRLLGEGKI